MVFLNIVEIPLIFFADNSNEKHIVDCFAREGIQLPQSILPFFGLIHILGWYGTYRLLVYEYRKGLSESWYSSKMYWILNFLV